MIRMLVNLIEICSDVLFIEGKNNGKFPYSHSFLILENKKEGILVDTGCGIDILTQLSEMFQITSIINSHSHPDHTAGNWVLQNQIEDIYLPQESFSIAGDIEKLSERFTEPGELAKLWQEYVSSPGFDFKPFKPTKPFNENSQFQIGKINLEPIFTPGHTKDHYCFYLPKEKVLFTFDIDLTSFGPWYGHRESDIAEFKSSIEKIQQLEVDFLVSSHKGIIKENINEKLNIFKNKINERTDKVKQLASEGHNASSMVNLAPIYGSFPYAEALLRYWEEQMIKKHLALL